MKSLKAVLLALLLCSVAFAQAQTTQTEVTIEKDQTISGKKVFSKGVTLGPIFFSALTTTPPQTEGTLVEVSDASATNPCVGGGTGAFAKRINGVWDCSGGGGGGGSSTWNAILTPTGNMSLSLGLNTSLFTIGDFGASPVTGAYKIIDTASNTSDTTTNFLVNTGASSRHNPVTFQIQGTNQLQICWQPGPQGQIVVGSAVTCSAINQSPFAKLVVESNTGIHGDIRLYQRSTSATATMLEMNNATASSSAYNFFTACSGASATDTSCPGGNIVGKLDGRGFFTAQEVISPIYTGAAGVQLQDGPGTSGVFISGGDVDINDVASNQINLIGGDVGSTVHGSLFLGGTAQGVDLHSSDGNVQLGAFNSTLNAIATLSGTAFTTNVNMVAPTAQWTGITGLTQCLHANSAGVVSGTGVDCGAGSGSPGGATLSFQYNNAGSFAGPTVGVNKGFYVFGRQISAHGTPVAPNEFQVGDCVTPGSISGAGTSYTVVYTDVIGCNVAHDRAASGSATITIPTPATLDNATPFFYYSNYSPQSDTLTPTTYTISQGAAAAAATLAVPSGITCKVQLDPVNASTWKAACNPMSTSGGASVAIAIPDASQFAGADMFAKITAAINACPTNHSCRVNATGFTGLQVVSAANATLLGQAMNSGGSSHGGRITFGNVAVYVDGAASFSDATGVAAVGTPAISLPTGWTWEGLQRGSTNNTAGSIFGTSFSPCTGSNTPVSGCTTAFPVRSFAITGTTVSGSSPATMMIAATGMTTSNVYLGEPVAIKGAGGQVAQNGMYSITNVCTANATPVAACTAANQITVTVPNSFVNGTSTFGTLVLGTPIFGFQPGASTYMACTGSTCPSFGQQINNIGFNLQDVIGAEAIQNMFGQEQSGVDHILVNNFGFVAIPIYDQSQNSGPYSNLELYAAGTNCDFHSTGIMDNNSGIGGATVSLNDRGWMNWTINANTGGGVYAACTNKPRAAAIIDRNNTSVVNGHCEFFSDGVLLGATNAVSGDKVDNLQCGVPGTNTRFVQNVVEVSANNPSTSDYQLYGLQRIGVNSVNVLLDGVMTNTLTDTYSAACVQDKNSSSGLINYLCSNPGVVNQFQGGVKSNSYQLTKLWCSSTAPTISSGFGTSPSVSQNNGNCDFRINVGTGGSATSGVIGLPTATTGWNCTVNDITAAAAHVAYNTRVTNASTTTVTVENQTTSTGAAVAWGASDVLILSCAAF